MSLCLLVGGALLALGPGGGFTLDWTHSVEKLRWREAWRVTGGRLVLTEARVAGSGAGMEPGPGAIRVGDAWIWTPAMASLPALTLASSGATGSGWRVCAAAACRTVGAAAAAPVTLRPCAPGPR